MNLISVIVPMYNAQNFIEKCIASLCNQSYAHWEAVIVDDGSTDHSLRICTGLASSDSRIKVVHQENQGVSAARNMGLQHAAGDYVMFLDADDTLDASTFSEMEPYIQAGYDVICWSLKTDSETNPIYCGMSSDLTLAEGDEEVTLYDLKLRAFSGWSAEGEKDSAMHFAVTKLMKRQLLLEHGLQFDTALKHCEDTLFTIQVTEAAKSIAAVNRYLYIQSIHPESATVSYCPGIDAGSRRYLALLRSHIQAHHSGDEKYEIAFAKYQLSCFLRCVQLDCMHPKAPYSSGDRVRKIAQLTRDAAFLPRCGIWKKGFKMSHRALYYFMKCRLALGIYICSKAGIL